MTSVITVKTASGWQYVTTPMVCSGLSGETLMLSTTDDYRRAKDGRYLENLRAAFPDRRFELKHIEE